MVQGVLSAADVQRVAVRQEGLAAQSLDVIADRSRPVGTKIRQVARLTEVDLDGHEFAFEIDVLEAGLFHEALEFLQQALFAVGAQVGEVYGCFFHGSLLIFL